MKQMYEAVVVFDGSLPDDILAKEQEKVEQFLQKNAEHEKTDILGKKTLAYEINKKKSGYYCIFLFNGEGDICDKLNKSFRLNQKILRHLTVLYEAAPVVSPEILKAPEQLADSEEGEE